MLNHYSVNSDTITLDGQVVQYNIGASPKKVEVLNKTTGAYGFWLRGMNNGELFVVDAGGGSGGTGMQTSDGISVRDDIENADGTLQEVTVELGTIADFNDTASEELIFIFSY